MADFQMSYKYENAGVYVVDNTDDEILNAVMEFYGMVIDGKEFSASERDLQNRYDALFTARNFGYYSKSQISPYFLRKHSHLLQ